MLEAFCSDFEYFQVIVRRVDSVEVAAAFRERERRT